MVLNNIGNTHLGLKAIIHKARKGLRRNTPYKKALSIGLVMAGYKTKDCRLQHKALCTLLRLSLLSFCSSCVRRRCRCPFLLLCACCAPSFLRPRCCAVVVVPSSLLLLIGCRLFHVCILCCSLYVTSASLWTPTANPIAFQSKDRLDGKIVVSLKPAH